MLSVLKKPPNTKERVCCTKDGTQKRPLRKEQGRFTEQEGLVMLVVRFVPAGLDPTVISQ